MLSGAIRLLSAVTQVNFNHLLQPPPRGQGLGFKISLVGGMLTYCAFIASNIKVITWVLVAAAGLEGLGAAILWTAQGAFLMSNTNDDNMGLYSGIVRACAVGGSGGAGDGGW